MLKIYPRFVLFLSLLYHLDCEIDDHHKYPMINNREHLIGRLTYLGPSVGVEAGKRNKAASLDHGLRGCAHRRLRAAVAQVVLVVRKLLLSSHNYCLDICSDFESIVYQVDRIVQSQASTMTALAARISALEVKK